MSNAVQDSSATVFYVPTANELRARVGNVSAWSRRLRVSPRYTSNLLRRYGGRQIDLARIWGEDSRLILREAAAVVKDSSKDGREPR